MVRSIRPTALAPATCTASHNTRRGRLASPDRKPDLLVPAERRPGHSSSGRVTPVFSLLGSPRRKAAGSPKTWTGLSGTLALFVFCSSMRTEPTMTQTSALSVIRNRAAVAEELRRLLPRLEEDFRAAKTLPLGLSVIDRHLPRGGLPCGALHEIVP